MCVKNENTKYSAWTGKAHSRCQTLYMQVKVNFKIKLLLSRGGTCPNGQCPIAGEDND